VPIEKLDQTRRKRRSKKKYARICIKVDIAKLLPALVRELNDLLWIQKRVIHDKTRKSVGKPHLLDARLRAKI
jgi:hypothetical protein